MLDIKNYKSGHGYDYFELETAEGNFVISFENNLDSYWSFKPKVNFLDTKESYDVRITKENYFLYLLFNELYDSIKTGIIKTGAVLDDDGIIYADWCDINHLFVDDSIYYLSDDFIDEEASSFRITKEKEEFKIIFTKSHSNMYFNTFAVRIRNSGCAYGYLNIPFMNLYNKLVLYSKEEYHQIHIEEYLYSLKKRKDKR